MTSQRAASIAVAVRASFPEVDHDAVLLALAKAARSAVAIAQIDKHLKEHPDALTSGHSNAPPPIMRLVAALQEIGIAAKSPACGKCGRLMRLPYKMGNERWCVTCYSYTTKILCVACGKEKKIGARTPTGPICQVCVRKSKPEPCVDCGDVRPVATRRDDGPRCQACTPRLKYECSQCGNLRAAHSMVDGLPVCSRCYRPPERLCGVCGRKGIIRVQATGTTPDICARCYKTPLKPCPDCGIREPCEHDKEYFQRSGNNAKGTLDGVSLARRRRMAPRTRHQCSRCQRDRPAQAIWPMGPVCGSCYAVVLRHPAECPGCSENAALIGRDGDEVICGPCAGVDRTYQCRVCGEPGMAVADGRCARCHAQQLIDGLLVSAPKQWEPLRKIPQETDSPLALVTWLHRSRGAELLQDLIRAEVLPSHSAIPAGKAENYLRSLLVEADILDARIEPLERLTDWLDELVRGDAPEIQQVLQRFAQWHVLRRARRRASSRDFTESSGKWARQQVSVARRFLYWLGDRDVALEECSQAHIDLWLASGNTRRYLVRDFIAWSQKDGLIGESLSVPRREVRDPKRPIEESERWVLLRRLLNDESIPDDVRLAGCLVLVYAQHLSRVVALTPDAVSKDGDLFLIKVADNPLPLPGSLAEPLRRLTQQSKRGRSSVSRKTAGERWLFPGGNPGHHITAEYLRTRLAKYGITLREARHAALLQWAQDTPGPILASSLGLHINTAVAWRDAIQADYAEFVVRGRK